MIGYRTITRELWDEIGAIPSDDRARFGLAIMALPLVFAIDLFLSVILVPAWCVGWMAGEVRG